MILSDSNVTVDRDKCVACGLCVDRCIMDNLRLSVAPCRQACPLSLNCQGYTRYIAKGKGLEGARELRARTPFGAILGRVCDHPCESACERKTTTKDGAVHLRALKRYLADNYPEELAQLSPKKKSSGKRVAVIGSGPAGLMAAHELAVEGHAVTIFEAEAEAGGMLRYGIPASKLPVSVLNDSLLQVTELGVTIQTNTRLGQDIQLDELRKEYDAVVLALGLWKPVRPAIEGADLPGICDALDVLKQARMGTLAPQSDSVAIIGGSGTAVDVALTMKRLGVKTVSLIARKSLNDLPILEEERAEMEEEGIIINARWGVDSIAHDGKEFVVTMRRCLSGYTASGEFVSEMDEFTQEYRAGMLVFATGQTLEATTLPLTAKKLIDCTAKTGQLIGFDNVFVAGDCTIGSSSVATAMASGKKAGACVSRLLRKAYPLALDDWEEHGMLRDFQAATERSNGIARGTVSRIPVAERTLTSDVELAFSPEQAKAEADRCLSCGRAFEANKTCWSCLPCEIECPESALTINMPYLIR